MQKIKLKDIFFNLSRHKIWVKTAIVMLLIVTVPVALLGIMLINTSRQAVRKSVLNGNKEIAARAAQEIELFIKKPQDMLATTAETLSVVYPAPWKQETVLVELALNQPILLRISSLDLSGQEIASSELGKEQEADYSRGILPRILKGKTYVSGLKISDSHVPYMTMAVPIKKLGKVIGGIAADVNLRGLWRIVDSIKLENTGRAFLIADNGTIITHQDKKRVLKNENIGYRKDAALVLNGRSGAMELSDRTGRKLISSFAPVSTLGWGLILEQEQSEAYLFFKKMKMQSWIIIILSELAVILASILMARVLTQPIKLLVAKFKSLAAEKYDEKININRSDELGEMARSFNDMVDKLKIARSRERFSAIGEASAWIAHEFKNSLVGMKSFAQLLPENHTDKKFIDKFSGLILREISHWERMLKELSEFSNHKELMLVQADLKAIIKSVLLVMDREFQEKQINIAYNAQDENLYVKGEPEKLKQVFMNLIINAIKAMGKNGCLSISAGLVQTGAPKDNKDIFIEVRVGDTGTGIPEARLEKIFEPFHTTRKGNIGLGLTITRKIVEQHGGYINVASELGKGTTFIVRLPAEVSVMGNNISQKARLGF